MVKSDAITQTQADAMKAEVTQRVTDQVNGLRHHCGDHRSSGSAAPSAAGTSV